MADPGGRDLIAFLDGYEQESETRKQETPLVDAEINAAFFRGNQSPSTLGPASPFRPSDAGQYHFVMNVVKSTLQRHVSLLTDSRPQMNVVARHKGWRAAAEVLKQSVAASWDEQSFEQLSAREMVRAGTIGSTVCVPMWDHTADYGRGQIVYRMYDPRQFKLDPSVVHAVDIQRLAEFAMVREVVPLNAIREGYRKGNLVQPSARWSQYGSNRRPVARGRSLVSPMQTPWKRRDEEAVDSMSPRAELRHTWFRDYARDEEGKPLWGPDHPRHIRYVVDAEGVVLVDARMPYLHGQIPCHMFDWDIEFEHPWGIPLVSGLRRMQWTLNRIVGQIMENVILTNRIKVVSDAGAVDPKTWESIASNPNGIFIKKRQGHTFQYELPANVVPAYVIQVVQMLLQGIDMVTGLNEAASGRMPRGQNVSGVAIDNLQVAAQSVIRMQARCFESWLTRIFQQVIVLIWQFYTDDRLLHLIGPGQELAEFAFTRRELMGQDDGKKLPESAWQDFTFHIMPASSLAMTRLQKGVVYMNLYQMGLVSGEDVLKAGEIPNPEETVKKARMELAQGLGPGQRASRKMQRLPSVTNRTSAIGV